VIKTPCGVDDLVFDDSAWIQKYFIARGDGHQVPTFHMKMKMVAARSYGGKANALDRII